ncbi:MAG: Holliday junction resolvase RuvX [Flavobacteriales bacterium]
MPRVIGIDFGIKRVGLAVTDPMQLIASGLTSVSAAAIFSYLASYLKSESVDCFVVGLPRRMSYECSESEPYILKFIENLKAHFPGIPVRRVDERFTSKIAVQSMIAGGLKKKKRRDKARVDEISATLILQSYLERKK